jgi:hypothetical protein
VIALVRDNSVRLLVDGQTVAESKGKTNDPVSDWILSGRILISPYPNTEEVALVPHALGAETLRRLTQEPFDSVLLELKNAPDAPEAAQGTFFHLRYDRSWSLASLRLRLSGRGSIYENARRIAADFRLWGSGAGTFETLYTLYRRPQDAPASYAHNDWLEFRITLGWVGLGLLIAGFGGITACGFARGHTLAPKTVVALTWLGPVGCLIYAIGDLPFQVYSVFFLFVVVCSIVTIMGERTPRDRANSETPG